MRLMACALAWCAVPAFAQPGADVIRNDVRAWRQAHEREVLREYLELLAIPNLAGDAQNIPRNAERIAAMLEVAASTRACSTARAGRRSFTASCSFPALRRRWWSTRTTTASRSIPRNGRRRPGSRC